MKLLVALVPGQNKQALSLFEKVGSTIIEHHEFIETYFIEAPIEALEALAMSSAVSYVGFELYHSFVKGIEFALRNKEKYHIRIMNISLGPIAPHSSKPFVPNDPVNLATKRAFEQGIVVVVAAGNGGPEERTLNPWSAAPWVIGVGAAINRTTLADTSSRGDPNDLLHIPTIVALGEYLKPGEEPRPPPGAWTSFAAPRISFLASVCIEFIETLQSFMNQNVSRIVVGEELAFAWLDTGIDESRLTRKHRVPGGRHRDLSERSRRKLRDLQEFLQSRKIPCVLSAVPENVKMMLKAMAKPMKGKPHEVGAGFVDQDIATSYLENFSARKFMRLFAKRKLTVREQKAIDRFEQHLGPLMSPQEIEMILDFCDLGTGFVDIRVAKR